MQTISKGNESTNPTVYDRESRNQSSENDNEDYAERDPGVIRRNPSIVVEEGT
jgi:hypothetical protein